MSKKSGLFAEVSNLKGDKQKDARSGQQRKRNLREIHQLVGEVRSEDGLDPRYVAKRRRRMADEPRPGFTHGIHKQEQFGCQIQSAVDEALQYATTPILNGLTVREVVKQKAVFMVIVEPRDPTQSLDLIEASAALEEASPMLRREVAAAITRKEVPLLKSMVLPAGAEKIAE